MKISNKTVIDGGHTYRIPFTNSGRCLGVFRKVGKRAEVALDMDKPRAKEIIAMAREQI